MTNYFCDNCGKSVGAYESYIYGRFCSEGCTERAEIAPKTNDDIIANLVKRVAELERFIAGQRSENQLVYDNIEGVKDDIETWSREIETLKHASKETDDKIEMVIDDIVTLDERTADVKPRRCCGC